MKGLNEVQWEWAWWMSSRGAWAAAGKHPV